MHAVKERIAKNLADIQGRMADAAARAGRSPDSIRLVAVTKTVGVEEARALQGLGITDFGENRVEVGQKKIEAMPDVCWHMIGNVQRRKARDVVALFDTVDAIDRLSLATALQQRCDEQDKNIDALVEVNMSGEESKHGFTPETLNQALSEITSYNRLNITGLMTMAPFGAESQYIRSLFRKLKETADAHGLPELSMGMTDDFEIAIEEGATQIRVGRALFA